MTFIDYVIGFGSCFVAWAVMHFFFMSDGGVQRWRLRNALDNIVRYIQNNTADGHPPCEVTFYYKNKKFSVGVLKNDVEHLVYKNYDIYINGDDAGKLHCLQYLFHYNYLFKPVNNRSEDEIIKIIQACNKHIKKLEEEYTEKEIPEWRTRSYFD